MSNTPSAKQIFAQVLFHTNLEAVLLPMFALSPLVIKPTNFFFLTLTMPKLSNAILRQSMLLAYYLVYILLEKIGFIFFCASVINLCCYKLVINSIFINGTIYLDNKTIGIL